MASPDPPRARATLKLRAYHRLMRTLLFSLLALSVVAWGCGGGTSDTASTGGTGGVSVILNGGGEIPAPPDGEKLCPAGACNYQTSAGCTADKPSCVPALAADNTASPSCEPSGAG